MAAQETVLQDSFVILILRQKLQLFNAHAIATLDLDHLLLPFVTPALSAAELIAALEEQGFASPTEIQARSWPKILAGKDLIAIAETGSGKTLAYAVPALIHAKKARSSEDDNATEASKSSGAPSVLILAPTRELAMQIEHAIHPFCQALDLSQLSVYGGASKTTQVRAYRSGVEILVATPGRLLDLVASHVISLKECSMLVLDEADRMLSMGFEASIQDIILQLPTQRQVLLWSATWPQEVRALAEAITHEAVLVTINGAGLKANANIAQKFITISEPEKLESLTQLLSSEFDGSRWLCFCSSKKRCDELTRGLRAEGWPAMGVHGEKCQLEREWVLREFRAGNSPIMLATDLAARGLDVPDISVVLNYDLPTVAEDYIHRIGRTGRGGATGTAVTFLPAINTSEGAAGARMAAALVRLLHESAQKVPVELLKLAAVHA